VSNVTLTKYVCVPAMLLLLGSTAQAATLSVNCGGKYGLTTINAALNALQHSEESHGPSTINVSGACHENILIQNLDRLTLNAVNGASITDASFGTSEVIDVDNSHGFTLQGFTITSTCPSGCTSPDAISCYNGADCLLIQNTISGASPNGSGVGVYALSRVRVVRGIVQNNGVGLFATDSGEMLALGVTVQGNGGGVVLNRGANILVRADHVTPSVIANNQSQGIYATDGSTITVAGPSNVLNNAADGIQLDLGAKLVLATFYGPVSVTGNGGSGVELGDLAIARFTTSAHVTGNGQPDVACNAPTAVTRFAKTNIGGGTTNCAN
jgi:Right handed beta helix region